MSSYANTEKVYLMTLDPVHIGEGGYRLGRVDNTIVRDPATDVPKIPGTSIAGVVREFYTIHIMENGNCKDKKESKEKRECAEEEAKNYFGDDTKQGKFRFYDGQIIYFPVSSIQGTVWVTTKEILKYWFNEVKDSSGTKIQIPDKLDEDKAYIIKGDKKVKSLNLGWLLIEAESVNGNEDVVFQKEINDWVKRIAVVSDKLFSNIVNDNLEVRTSVRINPKTGTAESGALFTYEAIPRGTVMGFEIGIDKRKEDINNVDKISIKDVIDAVSPYFKLLGIGGMGTRGFGRIEIIREGDGTNV